MNKVAIYIRVSTLYQVDKDSLPMQRQDLIAYSELILGIADYVIFEDAGYSGKNTDRPAFQDMMRRVRKGEFSHILVWKIDRISRNLLDFSKMYDELKRLKVTFVSKNEQFDTSTAIGGAMLKIILVFAELERNMTAERVTATMISRASSGQWNGGKIPFAYAYENGIFTIVESEAEVVRAMRDLYLETESLSKTAKALNQKGYKTRSGSEWSPNTVWIIVQSPFYAGIYRYNRYKGAEQRTENPADEWILVEDHHPAIISVADYEKMTAIRKTNAERRNVTTGSVRTYFNVHVFGGIVFCGKCGMRMSASSGKLQADGYRTSIYTCPNKRKGLCDNPAVIDLVIGEFVINYILNILNAKRTFSFIKSLDSLQNALLKGLTFKDVKNIDPEGLEALWDVLSRYKSDKSFDLMKAKPKKKRAEKDPEIEALKKEKTRQERALERLQDLYLYGESSISQKDFILRKKEISDRLDDINSKLGASEVDASVSDADFMRMASHLIISDRLKGSEYIYYKALAKETAPEILKEYIRSVIDRIYVACGKVTSIVFKNGMEHKFEY